jgi:hypothetical protein
MAVATKDTPVGYELDGVKKQAIIQLMGSRHWGRQNPIHWDPVTAQKHGLKAPIATGGLGQGDARASDLLADKNLAERTDAASPDRRGEVETVDARLDRLAPKSLHDVGVDVVGLVDDALKRCQLALNEPTHELLKIHEFTRNREVHMVPVMEVCTQRH